MDIIDQISTTFKICVCTIFTENFYRLSDSIVLAKNFTGETGTVEKKKKSVNNWPFCEGVVDNIRNPTGHPVV